MVISLGTSSRSVRTRVSRVRSNSIYQPGTPDRLRDPDGNGAARHWIMEIHLVDPDGRYGGFYERPMLDDVTAGTEDRPLAP